MTVNNLPHIQAGLWMLPIDMIALRENSYTWKICRIDAISITMASKSNYVERVRKRMYFEFAHLRGVEKETIDEYVDVMIKYHEEIKELEMNCEWPDPPPEIVCF